MSVKTFTREEVAKNNDANSTWIIIDNSVYDVTKFLNEVKFAAPIILGINPGEYFLLEIRHAEIH